MRIAILQFAPTLGAVPSNLARADALLAAASARLTDIDLLMLPELAFTGYNFQSAEEIEPFLERRGEGKSAEWARRTARRLGAVVGVGYAERGGDGEGEGEGEEVEGMGGGEVEGDGDEEVKEGSEKSKKAKKTTNEAKPKNPPHNYNSLLTVSPTGHTLAHYRKTHLYSTDESWARESPSGWLTLDLPLPLPRPPPSPPPSTSTATPPPPSIPIPIPSLPPSTPPPPTTKTAFAICMDLNPQHFRAPPHLYELATHVRASRARLLLCSMAWLTLLSRSELFAPAVRAVPDMATVGWWVRRLRPLCGRAGWGGDGGAGRGGGGEGGGREEVVVVVVANRCGEEEGGARYAGSSCVLGLGGPEGGVRCWGVLGRGEEGVLVVDTGGEAGWRIEERGSGRAGRGEGEEGEEEEEDEV